MRAKSAVHLLTSQLFRAKPVPEALFREVLERCRAIGTYAAFVALDHVAKCARSCPPQNVNLAAHWLRITRDAELLESLEKAAIARVLGAA